MSPPSRSPSVGTGGRGGAGMYPGGKVDTWRNMANG